MTFQRAAPLALLTLCVACPQSPLPPPPALVALSVAPAQQTLTSGRSAKVTASGRSEDGKTTDVTSLVVWSSSNPAVVSVDAAGSLHGAAPGTASVTASSGGLQASAGVTVSDPTPVQLVISPASATLSIGQQQQFAVTGTLYSDGTIGAPPAGIGWSSSITKSVSIDSAGLAKALANGGSTVTAVAASLTGTAQVTVAPPTDVSYVVAPANATIAKGERATFKVTGTLRSDGSVGPPPATVYWSTDTPKIAAALPGGDVQGLNAGDAKVIATWASLTGSAALRVLPPKPISLIVRTPIPLIPVGGSWQLSVRATLLSDGTEAAPPVASAIQWSSSNAGILAVDAASGFAKGVSAGQVQATAASGGLTGPVTATVVAPPRQLMSIAITPDPLRLVRNGTGQLKATGTFSDGSTADVTLAAKWFSGGPNLLTITGPGTVHAGAYEGSAGIAAAVGPVGAQLQVYVDAVRLSFVTSSMGSGDFGSWALAQGQTGLAAADVICTTTALKAGLPGRYAAWVSDSKGDAFCRVHALGGTRAINCGLNALPTTAGPWMRVDGKPFVATLADLLVGKVVYPQRLDELGRQLPLQYYFTASDEQGALFPDAQTTCSDWTSNTGPASGVWVGSTDSTALNWTRRGTLGCALPAHLLCLEVVPPSSLGGQTASGPPVPAWKQTGKLAFFSSALGTGALGSWPQAGGRQGLAAGDAICQSLAAASGRPNSTFLAWLGDDAQRPSQRFTGQGPWVRVDGALLAASLSDLAGSSLSTAGSLDEQGNTSQSHLVWTGSTGLNGGPVPATCAGWTVGAHAMSGQFGDLGNADYTWGGALLAPCDSTGHLYCFEQ